MGRDVKHQNYLYNQYFDSVEQDKNNDYTLVFY